jgi:hypothetical protein
LGVPQDLLSEFDKLRARRGVPFTETYLGQLERQFPEPISAKPLAELKAIYSNKLAQTLFNCRTLFGGKPMLITSAEGIGKTSAAISNLLPEALDRAMASIPSEGPRVHRFAAFAFRSKEQAEKKVEEFNERGYAALAVKTFWNHLEAVCEELGFEMIGRDDFDDHSPYAVLDKLGELSGPVYDRLEEVRKNLWTSIPFESGTVVLVMTHNLAAHWHSGRITRAWHHPDFDPDDELHHHELVQQFGIAELIFDDPETDTFLHLCRLRPTTSSRNSRPSSRIDVTFQKRKGRKPTNA